MSRFIGISLLVIGFFCGSSIWAQSTDVEMGRQRIHVLQDELAEMLTVGVAGLSDSDLAQQKYLFSQKVAELDQLRSRYQALAVLPKTTPVTVEPQVEQKNADVETQATDKNRVAKKISKRNSIAWTQDIPKNMSEALQFLQLDPAHAFSALQNFTRLPDTPHSSSANLDSVGNDLANALQAGVNRGVFSSMPSLLSLLDLYSYHLADIFESSDDKGYPLVVKLNDIMESAIISWIRTRPVKQDIVDFLSASRVNPLKWIGGDFEGFTMERTDRIYAEILKSGWGQSTSDIFELISLSRHSIQLDDQWVAQHVNQISSAQEMEDLFKTSHFTGRLLILESALRRNLFGSPQDVTHLLFGLSSDLENDFSEIERMNEQGLEKEAEIATKAYDEKLSWLRWVASNYQPQFRSLNPSKEEFSEYQDYAQISLSYRLAKTFSAGLRPQGLPISSEGGRGVRCKAVFK